MNLINDPNTGWRAVADLGTNTFQLIIARVVDGKMEVLLRKKTGVELGRQGMSEKRIHPDAMERAFAALHEFALDLKQFNIPVEKASVFGTSAFRNAVNGDAFVSKILEKTGFRVQIISGESEAKYIFRGVLASGVLTEINPSLIVDIGGGSVEFILSDGNSALWKRSFETGGLRLKELFHRQDPIPAENIILLENYLFDQLQPLWSLIGNSSNLSLVGCSGSFDTLIDMRNSSKKINPGAVEEEPFHVLEPSEFYEIFKQMIPLALEDRLKLPGMIPLRAGMMVVALILIRLILQKIKSEHILVSTYSLKEGVLFSKPE